jgi:hypothetical protein
MPSPTHPCLSLVGIPQIRLLQIQDDDLSSTISCRLKTFALEDSPAYTALSYCWGPPEKRTIIGLQRKRFIIRQNLADFLFNERERRRFEPGSADAYNWMWIDALCIDQTNVTERNHQVNLMSNIYQRAEQVQIWLGKENPLAICGDVNWIMTPQGLDDSAKVSHMGRTSPLKSIVLFLQSLDKNPYWTRIWIIQEIMFGRRILVRWGPVQFDWDVLGLFFQNVRRALGLSLGISGGEYLSSQLHDPSEVASKVAALNNLADEIASSKAQKVFYIKARLQESGPSMQTTFKLYQLIVWFHSWKSTDVRDKVFALLGLASDSFVIMPDYEKSNLSVFRDLVDKILKQDGKGHLLSRRMEVSGFLARAVFGLSRLRAEKEECWRFHCKVDHCSLSYHEHHFQLVSYDGREYSLTGIDCPNRGHSALSDLIKISS